MKNGGYHKLTIRWARVHWKVHFAKFWFRSPAPELTWLIKQSKQMYEESVIKFLAGPFERKIYSKSTISLWVKGFDQASPHLSQIIILEWNSEQLNASSFESSLSTLLFAQPRLTWDVFTENWIIWNHSKSIWNKAIVKGTTSVQLLSCS